MASLEKVRVAILVDNGFEQAEMVEPRKALVEAGAETILVSPQKDKVRGWETKDWGDEFAVELSISKARADSFDALLLPGGVMNPDHLRMNPTAVAFVRAFFDADKPVAAICHGPWTIVEAKAAAGRRVTSWPSLQTDLRNAGAEWVDEQAVVDRNLVTSRKPDDIPAFNREMIKLFSQTRSKANTAA
jgi:protease I